MDPRFVHVQSGDCRLRIAVQGEGPLVLMIHGWPEDGSSWRRQFAPLARAGFTAAAMDVRGSGGSDAPAAIEAYDMRTIISDVQATADALGNGRAILVGHDLGALVAWNAALVDPERIRAVAGLAIPYVGQGREPFIDLARRMFTDRGRFFYQSYFQEPGVAEAECEADIPLTLRTIYHALSGEAPRDAWPTDKAHGETLLSRLRNPNDFPAWLDAADFSASVKELTRTGFRGGLNRYRNQQRDFDWMSRYSDRRIHQPALFIAGDRDPALRLFRGNLEKRMRDQVPGLRGYHILEACGHWTQQERPNRVNRLLIDWLRSMRLANRNAARRAA